MSFFGDYHTHTIYSHGKGTVEENVIAAVKRGLKEIAITDHGFHHMTYNVRKMDWPFIRKDVERMREKYPIIKILLGLESNFVSLKGAVDITAADMKYLDILVCGYHKFVKPERITDQFGFFLPNLLGIAEKRMTVKNTDAYIKALEKYEIDVISHICHAAPVDPVEVAKAAAYFGTLIEVNNKNIKAKTGLSSCTDKQWEKVIETGVEFIVDSDAHRPERVGHFERAETLIERVGLPLERVANWNRTPVFRSHKAKEELLRLAKPVVAADSADNGERR